MRFLPFLGAAFGVAGLVATASPQETTRVSVDSSGVEADGYSTSPSPTSISADGRLVAFVSQATNLVPGDKNGVADAFVYDRATGAIERVSVDSAGQEADGQSEFVSISADGRVVTFNSLATNLVGNDSNGVSDVFVHDRTTGATERVSVDSGGIEGNDGSYVPQLSADGKVVVFLSNASNLVRRDTNGWNDVFVHDRSTGITERVSVDSSGLQGDSGADFPSLSADGQIVAFSSLSTNLVANDTNLAEDVFVHDRSSGITERVSVDSSGGEGIGGSSLFPSLSGDGQSVAFVSDCKNLVSDKTTPYTDVYVHDRASGITERVSVDSVGTEALGPSCYLSYPSLSADGRIVAFFSLASNLVAGDTYGQIDVFTHDRVSGLTERVSVDSAGAEADGPSGEYCVAISADGHTVAFGSDAPHLVPNDGNGLRDVYVHTTCATDAGWTNYGKGFDGTNGVPSFTSLSNPVLGTTITLVLDNSWDTDTSGLLFIGFKQADIPSSWGGHLLVLPFLTLPIFVPARELHLTGLIPYDASLCGFRVDLQAIELDPGAAKGVAFTQGLELLLGH